MDLVRKDEGKLELVTRGLCVATSRQDRLASCCKSEGANGANGKHGKRIRKVRGSSKG